MRLRRPSSVRARAPAAAPAGTALPRASFGPLSPPRLEGRARHQRTFLGRQARISKGAHGATEQLRMQLRAAESRLVDRLNQPYRRAGRGGFAPRPGSAPAKRTTAKRLNVTPLKRRPQAAHNATDLRELGEYNVHETHAEPQLRRIRGLLEADAQRGRPTFIKQNLHLPPTRGRLHKLAFKAGRPPRPDKRSINLARAAAAATSQKRSLLGTRPASASAVRPSSASAVRLRPSSASVARPSSATVARPASATATSRRRRVGPTKAAPRQNARPRSAPARRRPVAPPPNWSKNWSKTWAKPVPSSSSSRLDVATDPKYTAS